MQMAEISRAMKHRWRWLATMLADEVRFDAADDECIVRYRRIAPLDAGDAIVTLLGSGRLQVVLGQPRKGQSSFVGLLPAAELASLKDALLASGLAQFDALRLARERSRTRRRFASPLGTQPLPCADLSRCEIQLTLARINAARRLPHLVDITLCAVQDEAAAYPEWTTITRYAEADRCLRALIDHPSLRPARDA